jgi:hypothetical protein
MFLEEKMHPRERRYPEKLSGMKRLTYEVPGFGGRTTT